MNRRQLFAIIGFAALGAAFTFADAITDPVETPVQALGNDYLFVGMFAILALALGLLALLSGRQSSLHQATMPEPEQPVFAPAPGSSVDTALGQHRINIPFVGRRTRERVRQRVRTAAIGALMRTTGCDNETAREQVDRGTWTDDTVAAKFLRSPTDSVGPFTIPSSKSIATPFRFNHRVQRTVDAITDLVIHRHSPIGSPEAVFRIRDGSIASPLTTDERHTNSVRGDGTDARRKSGQRS